MSGELAARRSAYPMSRFSRSISTLSMNDSQLQDDSFNFSCQLVL